MTRRRFISSGVFAALCGIATLAFAGVAEFKSASESDGCMAIPYQTTRMECKGYQDEVDIACKGRKFGAKRDEVEKFIEKIKDKQRNLEEAKSRNNRSAIPSLEATINELREKVTSIKADAAGNLYKANVCLAARERVQRVFKDATTSVKAETDPELKQYADILVAKYDKGAAEHVQAIVDVKNAKVNLIWVKDVTIP